MSILKDCNAGGWLRRAFLFWLVCCVGIFLTIAIGSLASAGWSKHSYLNQLEEAMIGATLALGVIILATLIGIMIAWTCRDLNNLRRMLVGAAIFATLVAIFYTEEDWRGKRAWENCKRELKAKGIVLDWDEFIPAPVPDDENFYRAGTQIRYRFKKTQTDAESKASSESSWLRIDHSTNSFHYFFNATKVSPLIAAEFIITPLTATTPEILKNNLTLTLDAPNVQPQVLALVHTNLGRVIEGAMGFQFSERQLNNLPPVQIRLLADARPTAADLENLLPAEEFTNLGQLHVVATVDKTIFQVQLTGLHITSAADYLKWSDQYVPALDEVREALKRPYAVLPGDYSRPYQIPIPNFVMLRSVAQTLAQRAQCDFLLNQPADALHELTLMHDVCRILQKPPTGKPMTLVEAMINNAIEGLYAFTITQGFQWHVWQEPQLAALQAQLQEVDLAAPVSAAFQTEPASVCRSAEIMPPTEFLSGSTSKSSWSFDKLALWFLPRGWIYQNMVNIARTHIKPVEGIDLVNRTVAPRTIDDAERENEDFIKKRSPFRFLAAIASPNYSKAMRTVAYNQTQVNEAQIACALERYQLAHGNYPAALDALLPEFMETIPHDIIGGKPLHYRRTADGQILLYSIGWNETDDGGDPGTLSDAYHGDWVWKN